MTDSRSLSLYLLPGAGRFQLGAYFNDGSSHSDVPQVVEGSSGVETLNSNIHGFGFTATHKLPLHGAFSGDFDTISTVDSNFIDNSYSGTISISIPAPPLFSPPKNFISPSAPTISDNLTGSLYQVITSTGGIADPAPGQPSRQTLSIWPLMPAIRFVSHLKGLANADYRQQFFLER